jgi:hypothetical protein
MGDTGPKALSIVGSEIAKKITDKEARRDRSKLINEQGNRPAVRSNDSRRP